MKSLRTLIGIAAGAAALILSFMPLITHEVEIAVHDHHIDHAVLMGLGIIAVLLLYRPKEPASTAVPSPVWLWITVLVPVAIMFLMAPNLYNDIDPAPLPHSLYHLLFVVLAAVTAYAGQRFVRGVGWMSAIVLEFMAFVAAWGYGVAPH